MTDMTRLATLLPATLLALSLVGCGGEQDNSGPADDDASQTTPGIGSSAEKAPDTDDALDVVRKWTQAFVDGDGKEACSYQTEEYTKQLVVESVEEDYVKTGASCEDVVTAVAALYEAFGMDGETTVTLVSASGNEATVKALTAGSDSSDAYGMVYADGSWLVAKDMTEEIDKQQTTANGIRWVENWCKVETGQTKAEAIAVMGEPTEEFGIDDDATPQISWSQGPYSFTAFMDTDGLVNRFYANYDDLGQTDLAKMPCRKDR